MGIWWLEKITIVELWRRTNQLDVNEEIKRRKYEYLEHILIKPIKIHTVFHQMKET